MRNLTNIQLWFERVKVAFANQMIALGAAQQNGESYDENLPIRMQAAYTFINDVEWRLTNTPQDVNTIVKQIYKTIGFVGTALPYVDEIYNSRTGQFDPVLVSIGVVPLASETVYGRVRLSYPPLSILDPIAIGDNDPRIFQGVDAFDNIITEVSVDANGNIVLSKNNAATLTSSQSLILNQFSAPQSASMWISGNARVDGNITASSFIKTGGLSTQFLKADGSVDSNTYLTGNQTITLSGDISGSGTTSIVTTIGAGKVTNNMLAGSIASSKLIGTDIATVGTITSGIWNGTAIANAYIGTGIDATKIADGTVTNTEFQYINTLTSNAQTQLDNKQPLDADLTAIAALTANGLLRKTAGVWGMDSSVYLTGNQTITLSGEASGSGATAIAVTLSNSAVIGKLLTGYVSGAGVVSATDSILTAIQKLNGNIGALVTGVSSVFGRTGAVTAQSGDYTTAQVTESGNLYFTNTRARAAISETITGIDYNNTTGVFSLTSGYVIPTTTSASNWDIAYANRITSLTTIGSSGSATLVSNVLNIPTYTLAGLGGQPLATNLTSLSGLTYASTSFVKMTAAGTFALDTNTYLTGNQTITLSGEASGSGTTSIAVTLNNASVIGKVLTGYVSGAGVISATDTILSAIQKLNGNVSALVTGVSSVFGRTGAVVAQSGDYTTAQVTESGNLYFTNARARASISETITGIDYDSNTGVFSLTSGYVIPTTTSAANWDTAYANRITSLTTTGSSGAATLISNVLNIPNYTLAGLGGVPYTGATTNVDLGEYGIKAGYFAYDTTPTSIPTAQGSTYWDVAEETIEIIMNGAKQHIGLDTFYNVKNSTGVTIPKGTAVRFAGTDGGSGHLLIAPFLANGTYPSTYYMGITAEDIANGDFGKVMQFGKLRGINTSTFTNGDILYASTTVAGGFQTTAPVAPNNIVIVAAVVHASNNGTLVVRATLGSNINSDEGVKITSPATGQLLQLQASGLWENKSVATILGGTSSQFVKGDGSLDSNVYLTGNQTITLSGEASGSGATSINVTLANSAVIGKVLTGLSITGGAITSSDTILSAFGKVQNQINGLMGGVIYKGTYNASTNTPTLSDGTGTQGWYYVVSVAGTQNFGSGNISFNIGDWAIYNGSIWEKVDNTDSVTSVNGQIGAVVLTTSNITEGTNLYYTNARARAAISETITGIDYDNGTGVFSLTSGYVIPTTTSASNWDTAYTNRITSLTTTGNSGSATLTSNTLNIPTYTLAGLGGQPLATNLTSLSGLTYSALSFVKMTAAGTFALDTNTYLTSTTGVTTIAGTANQVLVNGGTSAVSGAVTLSLPQSIATTSTVRFGTVGIGIAAATVLHAHATSLVTTAVSANYSGRFSNNSTAQIIQLGQCTAGENVIQGGRTSDNTAQPLFIQYYGSRTIVGGSTDNGTSTFQVNGTTNITGNTTIGGTLTVTGNGTFNGTSYVFGTGASTLNVVANGSVADEKSFQISANSVRMWRILGASTSTNLLFVRYDDTGTYAGIPMQIDRSTGVVSIGTLAVTANATIGGTLGVTGAVTGSSTAQFTRMGLGASALTTRILNLNTTITGGTSAFGVDNNSTIQSDVTGTAIMYRSNPSTQASAFTNNLLIHYYAVQGTIGATSSVNTQAGFWVENNLTGATTNYGFKGGIASGTGRWNIYMDGTASNYFNGNVLIGSTTDGGQKLQVTGTANISSNTTIGGDLIVDTNTLFVDSTNNRVGIRTTTPEVPLHVLGAFSQPSSASINGGMILSGLGVTSVILNAGIYNAPSQYSWLQSRHASTTNAYYSLVLQPLGGNVAINTITANRTLQVAGNVAFTNSDNTGALLFVASGVGTEIYSRAGEQSATGLPMSFRIGTTNAIEIDINRNIGLGTTPSYRLDVNGISRFKRSGVNGAGAATSVMLGTDAKTINDTIILDIVGNNSLNNQHPYARIEAVIIDPTGASEDSTLKFYNYQAGVRTSKLELALSGNIINGNTTFNGSLTSSSLSGFIINNGTELFTMSYSGGALLNRASGTVFRISENGSAQVTIASGGAVTIGGAVTGNSTAQFTKLLIGGGSVTLPTDCIEIGANKLITGSTQRISITNEPTIQSGVTLTYQGYRSSPSTQSTSFVLTDLQHFVSSQGTIGASSSITNQYGFVAQPTLIGATNNYGFFGGIPSGANRWNLYMSGTANNYFAGNVQIGSTTATAGAEKLQVTGTASVSGATYLATGGGNVGIGTTSPAFANGGGLEIERAGIATLRLQNTTASNSFELYVDTTANGINFYGANSSDFIFSPAATTRFRISTAGALTITTSPSTSAGAYELLTRNTSTGVIEKVASNYYATAGSISGTTGKLAKFTASGAIGDSVIRENGGNIGINVNPVNAKLEVVATTGEVFRADAAGGAYRIIADQSGVLLGGNVGIGTTSPASILEISQATPIFRIQASDTGSFHGIEFRQGAGFDAFIKQLPSTGEFRISNGRSVGWGGTTTFYTDTIERMRITSTGLVGIGAASPSSYSFNDPAFLVVANTSGNSTLSIVSSTTGIGYLAFADGTTGTDRYSGSIFYSHSTDTMSFKTAGSDRLEISSTGAATFSSSVTWGSAAGQYMYAGGSAHKFAYANSVGNYLYSGGSSGFNINNAADTVNLVSITDAGVTTFTTSQFGIGTTPSYALHIYNTGASTGRIALEGTTNFVATQYNNSGSSFYTGIDDSTGANFTGTAYKRFLYSSGAYDLGIYTNGTERFRIAGNGAATFSSTLTSDLHTIISGAGSPLVLRKSSSFTGSFYMLFQNTGASQIGYLGYGSGGNDKMQLYNGLDEIAISSGTSNLTVGFNGAGSSINTNFTATSFIKSGGTSAQFLKADGSVDSSTYLTTSAAATNYIQNQFASAQTASMWVSGDIKTNSRVYVGTNGCYIEEVLVGSTYELRVVDSAGNTTVIS